MQPRRLRPTALLRRGAGGKGERGGRDPAPGDPPARPCAAGGGDSAGAHGGGGGGARCGPGERPPPVAALGPALAPPAAETAAETAPKEKENLFVSACLPTARTSSPAAHLPALRVLLLLPPGLGAGPPAPAGRFPGSFPLEGFCR